MANPVQPYFDENLNQFVRGREPDVTLADETGAGTSGTTGSTEVRHGTARVEVDVTAFDGSALTVTVETSHNDTDYRASETVEATGVETVTADISGLDEPLDEFARVTWSHDGTSADFTVTLV